MCSQYYLQRHSDRLFDAVDQFVNDHHDKAIDNEGRPRYNGNRIAITYKGIEMHGTFTGKDLSRLMKLLSITAMGKDETLPGGFVQDVEFVRFLIKGKKIVHEVNGTQYKAQAA